MYMTGRDNTAERANGTIGASTAATIRPSANFQPKIPRAAEATVSTGIMSTAA